jgi:hypothetical protein
MPFFIHKLYNIVFQQAGPFLRRSVHYLTIIAPRVLRDKLFTRVKSQE